MKINRVDKTTIAFTNISHHEARRLGHRELLGDMELLHNLLRHQVRKGIHIACAGHHTSGGDEGRRGVVSDFDPHSRGLTLLDDNLCHRCADKDRL